MSSAPGNLPISLRSWTSNSKDNDPRHLPTIIQRINFERGGFHNITEESLRQEIAEAELNNEGDDDGSSEEEDEEEPDRAKELLAARDEILRQIDQAHQAAMLSTEVISAALSKEAPVQASASMSQELRSLIGTGTLGMDKLHAPRITSAIQEENKKTAKGWKVQGLNKSVDSILAAAERLKTEVEHETIFWGQVLAISDNHWAVCRLPYDKHTLGVRFGFSEASPSFRDRSLGALRRSDDGTITLDQGLAHVEPETLRVRIRAGSIETGSSKVPPPVPEDGPIESLILEARNTIFAQELWQELNREARTLGAYGVRSKDDTLVFPLSEEKTIVLDLVSLGDSTSHSSGVDDHVAEGITIAFNLLLTLAHRQNHRKRTQPPVSISGEKQATQAYNLLRPFLTRIKHQETVSRLHILLRPLCRALGSALPNSSPEYSMNTVVHEIGSDYPEPEKVLMRLTNNLQTATTFTITEDISMIITVRTNMAQVGSTFTVEASTALTRLCPPPPARFDTAFKTFSALQNYVHYAVACGLAFTVSGKPAGDGPVLPSLMGSMDGWQITAQPNVLRKTLPTQQTKQLAISILSEHQGAKIRVTWELTKSDIVLGNENSIEKKIGEERKGINGATKRGDGWFEWTDRKSESWDDNQGEVVESLMQIVEAAGK